MDDIPRTEVTAATDRLVRELLTAAVIQTPPVDAIALAQGHLGMVVCLDQRQTQRGRVQRSARNRQIYLRPEPIEERHQWTVAHEIGEHFKPELLRALGLEPEQCRALLGESLANLFAHRLLVPTGWFAEDSAALANDLLALKQRYRTASHEVIAWRWLDLPDPCIVTIVDNDRVFRRRSNAWPTRRELTPAEAKCQRRVSSHNEPARIVERGWTVQGWPLHQPTWKREILRSVVEE